VVKHVVVGIEKGFSKHANAGELLRLLKDAGVTSLETYVLWRDVEVNEGKYVFDLFDSDLELMEKYGIRWVPFIVIGPWYSTPDWFRNSDKSVTSVCLEHGLPSGNQSIWNPNLKDIITSFLNAFNNHYSSKMSNIESILVGISGDYGEAIQTVIGNWPGEYHGHRGYWAGDPYAVADFRRSMLYKYDSINRLNEAWGTRYSTLDEVKPFTPLSAPSRRAALDFWLWYKDSMSKWADWWLKTASSIIKGIDIYLVTGGVDEPEHASLFSEQVKIASKHGVGVRITNEASSFIHNFLITRTVSAASRIYGTYYSTEPAAVVTERGIVGRLFNAISGGAHAFHEYLGNLINFTSESVSPKPAYMRLTSNRSLIGYDYKPVVKVAVAYSQLARVLDGWWFSESNILSLDYVRSIVDFDLVDEYLINDALSNYRFLIIQFPLRTSEHTLIKILDWVRSGGVAIVSSIPMDIDGDSSMFKDALGITEEVTGISRVIFKTNLVNLTGVYSVGRSFRLINDPSITVHVLLDYKPNDVKAVVWSRRYGNGYLIGYSGSTSPAPGSWMNESDIYFTLIKNVIYNTELLGPGIESLSKPYDPIPINGLYPTILNDGTLLIYNSTDLEKEINISGTPLKVQPNSIIKIPRVKLNFNNY